MLPGFLLSLREGMEAALIVGIVLGTLSRLGRRDQFRPVWLGVMAAAGVSLLAALTLTAAGAHFEGRAEQVFEGVTLLLAAGVLTWMIFWMQGQGRNLSKRLSADVKQAANAPADATAAAGRAAGVSLFSLAFLAVVREGVELALFLTATGFATSPAATLTGASLGLAAAVVLGALIYFGAIRLNVRRFFQVTSLFLIVIAAGMVAYGFHEMIEASVIPAIVDPIYNINPVLNDKEGLGLLLKTLFGYNGNPALTESAAYVLYFILVFFVLRAQPARQAVSAR
jgi:high-affinity iron transporter